MIYCLLIHDFGAPPGNRRASPATQLNSLQKTRQDVAKCKSRARAALDCPERAASKGWMDLTKVSPGLQPPTDINVVVEVPLGGEPIKYEIDKASGAMVVDRFLYTAMRYPCNYGFMPGTLAADGDPVDVMVVGSRPLVPGAIVSARPVGVLLMEDEAGIDEKILAVPSKRLTAYYDKIVEYTDLPDILIERIQHFFNHYKDMEPDKWVKIVGWRDAETARELIMKGLAAH